MAKVEVERLRIVDIGNNIGGDAGIHTINHSTFMYGSYTVYSSWWVLILRNPSGNKNQCMYLVVLFTIHVHFFVGTFLTWYM